MIETIEGLPNGTVGFAAKNRVTRRDYEEVLVPKVEDAFRRHDRVRCYYELGAGFSGFEAGAVWEDFKIGLGHWSHWEKVAVVTDTEWIRYAVNGFRFLMPGDVRVFPTSCAAEARAWIAAA